MDVSASTSTTPEGYRYYNTWSGEPDEFKQWYGQWREKNPYGEPVISLQRTVLCFPQMSPEEIAERDAKSERGNGRRRHSRRRWPPARNSTGWRTRCAQTGSRKHATGFNGGQLRKATTRLSLLALTGTELCHGLISGASWNNIDNVLAAYNLLTATPLPYDDTSDRGLWLKRTSRNCIAASTSREPRTGSSCSSCAPRSKHSSNPAHGPTRTTSILLAQTYYHTLADLGYPTSDEENKSLNGCFLPKTTKRSEP